MCGCSEVPVRITGSAEVGQTTAAVLDGNLEGRAKSREGIR